VEPSRVTVTDVETAAAEFSAREFGVRALPFDSVFGDGSPSTPRYDLVWAGSVLTNVAASQGWNMLGDLARVTKPGGMVVFTTHGPQCVSRLTAYHPDFGARADEYRRMLAETGVAFTLYEPEGQRGIAVHSESAVRLWLRERLPQMDLLEFRAEAWDSHQDVWVLARKASGQAGQEAVEGGKSKEHQADEDRPAEKDRDRERPAATQAPGLPRGERQ
jgi:hypothetical protein